MDIAEFKSTKKRLKTGYMIDDLIAALTFSLVPISIILSFYRLDTLAKFLISCGLCISAIIVGALCWIFMKLNAISHSLRLANLYKEFERTRENQGR